MGSAAVIPAAKGARGTLPATALPTTALPTTAPAMLLSHRAARGA